MNGIGLMNGRCSTSGWLQLVAWKKKEGSVSPPVPPLLLLSVQLDVVQPEASIRLLFIFVFVFVIVVVAFKFNDDRQCICDGGEVEERGGGGGGGRALYSAIKSTEWPIHANLCK